MTEPESRAVSGGGKKRLAAERRQFGKAQRFVLASGIALGLTGAVFNLAPYVNYNAQMGSRKSGILASTLLWLMIIISVLLCRKSRNAAMPLGNGKRLPGGPGIISFFKTPPGRIADIVLIIAALMFLLYSLGVVRLPYKLRMLPFSMTLSSFLLHCFLNGKACRTIYKYKLSNRREESFDE